MIAALVRLNQIRRTFKAQGLAELIPGQNFGLVKRLLTTSLPWVAARQ
jgi:hypothetical protein